MLGIGPIIGHIPWLVEAASSSPCSARMFASMLPIISSFGTVLDICLTCNCAVLLILSIWGAFTGVLANDLGSLDALSLPEILSSGIFLGIRILSGILWRSSCLK